MNPDHINEDVLRISSGAASIDAALGGGWPRGRIVEVFGKRDSGKATLAFTALGGKDGAWVELYGMLGAPRFDSSYATACGWQNQQVSYLSNKSAHNRAIEYVEKLVRTGNHDLVVVGGVEHLKRGDDFAQRLCNQQMRKLCGAVMATRTCVMFLREVPTQKAPYFPQIDDCAIGNALKFYASVRVHLAAAPWTDKGKAGIVGQGDVCKNKYGPVFARFGYVVQHSSGLVAEETGAQQAAGQ